uniref:Phytocyanin domain-containing protein n=1 Tax=Lactuca sativa TaxID=4236 RepID=A0A9R1VLP7_LACSA|nr:hypothetical protein LSAT_V11C500282440 [Lactuca sativa]
MEKMTVAALLISMVVYGSQMKTTFGALYMVGDSAGWTTIGNVNYKQWAATKTFQFGDTIGTYLSSFPLHFMMIKPYVLRTLVMFNTSKLII